MKTSETLTKIAPDLVAFQREIIDPRKDSDNPYYKSKYVELDGLIAAVRPIANKHNLWLSQDIKTELADGNKMKVWCKTRLLHVSGEWVESEGQFNLAKGTDPQSCGSSQTYIRRYDISAFLGIAWTPDDDGNQGTYGNQKEPKTRAKETPASSYTAEPKKDDSSLPYKIPYIKDAPTAAQVNSLEVMCQYVGKNPRDMAAYYKVANLGDLKFYAYRSAYKMLASHLIKMGYSQGKDLNWHKPDEPSGATPMENFGESEPDPAQPPIFDEEVPF